MKSQKTQDRQKLTTNIHIVSPTHLQVILQGQSSKKHPDSGRKKHIAHTVT